MSSLSTYICFCKTLYDDETRKPCKGRCGHAMCLACVNGGKKDCSLCGQKDSFLDAQINYQMLELIIALRDKTELGFLKHEADNLCSGRCSVCKDQTARLRLCVDCCKSADMIFQNAKDKWVYGKDPRLLFEHTLCSSCACDNHKDLGHTVIFLEEIDWVTTQMYFEGEFDLVEKRLMYEKTQKAQQSHYDKSIEFYKNVIYVTRQNANLISQLPPGFDSASKLKKMYDELALIHRHKATLLLDVARYEVGGLREKLAKISELQTKLEELEDVCKQMEEFKLNDIEEAISECKMEQVLEKHYVPGTDFPVYNMIMAELDEIHELYDKITPYKVTKETVALEYRLAPLLTMVDKRLAQNPSRRPHKHFPFSEHEFLTKVRSFFSDQFAMAVRKNEIILGLHQDIRVRRDRVELLITKHFRFEFDEPELSLEAKLDARLREFDSKMCSDFC